MANKKITTIAEAQRKAKALWMLSQDASTTQPERDLAQTRCEYVMKTFDLTFEDLMAVKLPKKRPEVSSRRLVRDLQNVRKRILSLKIRYLFTLHMTEATTALVQVERELDAAIARLETVRIKGPVNFKQKHSERASVLINRRLRYM